MEDEDGDDAPRRAALWTERVMPYRLTDAWRETLGPDAEEIALGMALTGSPTWFSSAVPTMRRGSTGHSTRRRNGIGRSPVSLTRRVAEQPAWDEAALLRRSQELAERAVRVWPWEQGPMETE